MNKKAIASALFIWLALSCSVDANASATSCMLCHAVAVITGKTVDGMSRLITCCKDSVKRKHVQKTATIKRQIQEDHEYTVQAE